MIAFVGDLMVDVFAGEDGAEVRFPGGKAAIYAASAIALGEPAAVIGAVGLDEAADTILSALENLGAEIHGVQKVSTSATGKDFFEAGAWVMERGANRAVNIVSMLSTLEELHESTPLDLVMVNQGTNSAAPVAAIDWASAKRVPVWLALSPEATESSRRIDHKYAAQAQIVSMSIPEANFLAHELGISREGTQDIELAKSLRARLHPQLALIIIVDPGTAIVASNGAEPELVTFQPETQPSVPLEHYIGAGDSALGAVAALLYGKKASESLVELLIGGLQIGTSAIELAGPLTPSIQVESKFHAVSGVIARAHSSQSET